MSIDIGIDLGTSNTLVYLKGKNIVIDEPSVVAVSEKTGKVHAVGKEAREMLGRTPDNIIAVTPIKEGVIANFDATVAMMRHFIKMCTKGSIFKPRAVVCIPSKITEVEKRAIREATLSAGAKEVYLIEEAMAAAIGAGISVNQPRGSMIVDIGGGTTEIAIISLGGIVTSTSLNIAGNAFDAEIAQYLKKTYNLSIGLISAEEIKRSVASACPLKEEIEAEVKGRDMVTGLPKVVKINSKEIRLALAECMEQIIDGIKSVLERTPPELAADIFESGVVLTGGGAILRGLGKLININTGIPIYIAENPTECVVMGAGKTLEDVKMLKSLYIEEE